MARRKSSYLPTTLIALALVFAVYFALFGKTTAEENLPETDENPVVQVDNEPAPSTEPEPEPEPQPRQETKPPPPEPAPEPLAGDWKTLRDLHEAGKWFEARPVLARLFAAESTSDENRRKLAALSMKMNEKLLVFEPDERDVDIHVVQGGEVLTTIARQYKQFHGEWGLVAVVNRMTDPGRLRLGKKLRVPRGTWSLLADKSLFRMWLLYEGTPFKEYEIATGKDNKTPAAVFTVSSKTPKPGWTPPISTGLKGTIAYGDPRNPLGEYWIALQHDVYDGFGIHGTNDEDVIGTAVSNGCIRMHNKDAVEMGSIAFEGMVFTTVE